MYKSTLSPGIPTNKEMKEEFMRDNQIKPVKKLFMQLL